MPLSRVAAPVHDGHGGRYGAQPELLIEPGTFAVLAEPTGPPSRPWSDLTPAEAEGQGLYAPEPSVSFGPRGAVLVAPGDVRGAVILPDRAGGGCCGFRDGEPNMTCARCGRAFATRVDDCYWSAVVRLDPRAVVAAGGPGKPPPITGWADLPAGLPQVQPSGFWEPRWESAAGVALAHVLAFSGGRRLSTADPRLADFVVDAANALLPASAGASREVALTGPGQRGGAADIRLVPAHPETGQLWPATWGVDRAPAPWEVWQTLADRRQRRPVGAGAVTEEFRDDPPPRLPYGRLRPDRDVFRRTLARLPAVRQPWLREIYDRTGVWWRF